MSPVPVAALSEALVYGHSPAEIVGSNPSFELEFCILPESDGTESPLLEDHEESSPADKPKQITKCGELNILGYNGFLPPGDRGRRRNKFVLHKRSSPNGVKRSKHYVVKTPHSSQAILEKKKSHRGHGCLSVVGVVRCQVVSATS
jgi:hypothetical protein